MSSWLCIGDAHLLEPVACCSCGTNSQGTHRRRRPPLHRAPRSRSGSARASGSAAVRRPLPPLRRRRIAGHLQQPRRPRRPRLAATAARRPQERWGGARVDAGSGAVSGASRRAITCRSGGGGSDGSRMCLSHDGGPPLPDDTASPAAAQVTLAVCGSREDCHGD